MIEEARCRLDCGVTLELATDSGKLWKGEAISIDIRPENTRIGEGNGTDATFSGAIDLVEHLREVQILYLDLPGTTEKFLIKVDGESSFARLQDVRFTARLQDIHVLDAEGNVIPVSAGATV
ncbi:hypothetical protein [Sinorhizobium meliloti]|uniref:hypothetical protein n=1 Tax=Rhizobium meliloti TaxID=382 RepID=UPI00299F0718